MIKPDEQHIFKCVNGTWRELGAGDSAPTLAEFLEKHKIIIDDSVLFCHMYRNYEKYQLTIIYRVLNLAKITITFYYKEYE